jgi:hypothetical protein
VLFSVLACVGTAGAQQSADTKTPDEPTIIIDAPPKRVQPRANRTGEVPLHMQAVRARFHSPTSGVSFFLRGGTARFRGVGAGPSLDVGFDRAGVSYRPGFGVYSSTTTTKKYGLICEAPCEASLAWGQHSMALSHDGGIPVAVSEPVGLFGPSIVDGRYVDRSKMRKAGWWVFGAGFIAGVFIMIAGLTVNVDGGFESVQNGALFGSGMALMGASIVIGVPMLTRDDRASIRVYPLE